MEYRNSDCDSVVRGSSGLCVLLPSLHHSPGKGSHGDWQSVALVVVLKARPTLATVARRW